MNYFTCDVIGSSFCDDYPNNLWTIKEMCDSGEKPTLFLSKLPEEDSVIVFCAAVGGSVGRLPQDLNNRLAKLVETGVVFSAERVQVYFADEDIEGTRPMLNITFVRE
jgi:hypothetical protein